MLLIEILVLLFVFTTIIYLFVRKSPVGGLHWYPKEVQKKAVALDLVTRQELKLRKKISSYLMLFLGAVIILGSVFWINNTDTWLSAFIQIYLMAFVLNWYDGIVIDYLWVAKTDFWKIEALEDMMIAKSQEFVLRERMIMSIVYLPIAALFACIALQ